MEKQFKVSCTLCKKIKGESREKLHTFCIKIFEKEIQKVNFHLLEESKNLSSNININFRQLLSKDRFQMRNLTIQKFSDFFFSLPYYTHDLFLQIINIFDYFISFDSSNHIYDDIIICALLITLQKESISIYDGYDNLFIIYTELNQSGKIEYLVDLQNKMLGKIGIHYPTDVFCDFLLYVIHEYFLNLSFLQKKKKGTPFSKRIEYTCYIKYLTYFLSIKLYEEVLKNFDEKFCLISAKTMYLGIFWTIVNHLHYLDNKHINFTILFKLIEDLNIDNVDEFIEFNKILENKFKEFFCMYIKSYI